jgi:hypothetical protein
MEFVLRYQSWASLKRDCEQQLGQGGLLVRTAESPALFSPAQLLLELPDGATLTLAGQVVQVLPGLGTAVQFGAEARTALAELQALCVAHPEAGPANPDDPLVNPPDLPSEDPGGEDAQPGARELASKLEAMTVNEKRQAALHGQRGMRLAVIRDRNKTLHQFVLRNPGLTLDEVEQFAKMPGVSPDALRMMATNPEWTRSPSVCRNLVKNPKTPLKESLDLLNKLPLSEVRALAKSQHVRAAIQQAARRKVNA